MGKITALSVERVHQKADPPAVLFFFLGIKAIGRAFGLGGLSDA